MRNIIYLAVMFAILCGCSKGEESAPATLSISGNIGLTFKGDETTGKTISFQASHDWSASSSTSWCKLSKTSGTKGSGSITVTVEKNGSDEARSANITITAKEATAAISVKQERIYVMSFTESDYVIPCTGDTIEVKLSTNIDYEYTIPQDAGWIKPVTKTRAVETFTHHFLIEPNTTYDNRSASIDFINKDTREKRSISISQLQLNAIIPADSLYTIEAKKHSFDFGISSNVDYKISVSADWIKCTQNNTKALVNKNITLEVEENNSFAARSATVTIQSDDIVQNVKIIQNPWANRMNLSIVHNEEKFVSPYFNGRDLAGTIDWGNGKSEEYRTESGHDFGNNGEKTTVYKLHGTKIFSFEIPAINSIKSFKIVYKEEEE